VYDVSRFVAIGNSATGSITLTSYDGSLWTIRTLSSSKLINSSTYGGVPKSASSSIYVFSSLTVIDSALIESDPSRFMSFEGSSDANSAYKGVGVRGTASNDFKSSGFTHEHGPDIIFS
jgi:hypothetical protein